MADEGAQGQDDGGADDKGKQGGDEYAELRASIESERKARKAAEKKAKQLTDRFDGIDPEEVRTLLEEKRKAEEDKARAEGDFESLREKLEAKHQKEMEALAGQIEGLTGSLRKKVVDAEIERQLGEIGVLAEYRPGVRALWKGAGPEMVEKDGDYVAVLKDDLGDPVTVAEWAKQWASSDEAAAYLPASGSGGAGTDPESRRRRDGARVVKNTPENIARYADEINAGEVVLDGLQQSG